MHGQYIRNIDRQLISEEDTFLWLSKRDLKAETESEIVAAQDQAINTKYYATKILNTETDNKCRLCQEFDETIYRNTEKRTDRTTSNNKPDIIICDNGKRTCVNICCNFGCRNVIKKGAETILKYKNLTIEIQRIWNIKTNAIPVIIGATGTISESFRKYVSNILGNHKVEELQKTAILDTAHILRKVLT
jgi:hypothetical protein